MNTLLTPAEIATVRAKIVRLEKAYEEIISGTAVRKFVDQNGEQVEYTNANAARLLQYINELKAMLSPQAARRFRPRPVGFIFPRQ